VKICTLASVFGVRVVPHGHNIHAALHVIASQSPATCPLGEYLLNWMPNKIHFEKDPLVPSNGFILLPDRPGFGIELDEKKVERMEVVSYD
jgi:L-alanine-DL-glutamate epimerase-like enolase superfamily enzyme